MKYRIDKIILRKLKRNTEIMLEDEAFIYRDFMAKSVTPTAFMCGI